MMVGTVTAIQYRETCQPRRHLPLLAALLCSALIAGLGWRLGALTGRGTLAAIGVGTLVISGTGLPGLFALGVFFAGSSGVSHLAPDRTAAFDAKGGRRDAVQVLANGGWAALGALLPAVGLWVVTGALAAAAADTWATSVGGWSRTPPRDVRTFRPVLAGTSGGITLLGTAGAAAGAASVGLAAGLMAHVPSLFPMTLVVGMLGMLADSLLGATLQGRFHCDGCNLPTERRVHRCGRPSRQTGGLAWLTNDGVNAIATLIGAAGGLTARLLYGG